MIKGPCGQKIIQGKSYSLRLQFSAEDSAKIQKLWFSCSALDLVKEMTLGENNIYTVSLTWEETQELKPMTTTYNITVQFLGDHKRDLANGLPLMVIKNLNPVNEEE